MQSDADNELVGLEGRTEVLVKLSEALAEHEEYFGADGRPGNLVGEQTPFLTFAFACIPFLCLTVLQTTFCHIPQH